MNKAIPQIEKLVIAVTEKMKHGGRLFYIGAGTSGRLGVVDALLAGPTQIILPNDGNIYAVAQSTFTLGNVKAFGTLGVLQTS